MSYDNEPRAELVAAVVKLQEQYGWNWGPERVFAELKATGWDVTREEAHAADTRASGIRYRNDSGR